MPNRLDVELTSHREDGAWTWRVVGARQPKGVAEPSVVPDGSRVGDVFTVEAEVDLDGISVISMTPKVAKERDPRTAGTIEMLGSPGSDHGAGMVTSALVRPSRDRVRPRRERRDEGESARLRREPRAGRPPRDEGPQAPASTPAPRGRSTEGVERRRPAGRERSRTTPPSIHRDAFLETLAPEQRAIADRLVAGGLPAVRRAIDAQNETAKAAGNPEVPAGPILAMAESILPRLRAAAWCDRAETALTQVERLPVRDLRTLLGTADEAGRDDPGKALLARLRSGLEARVTALRAEWESQMTALLDDGQMVRALRASASPPDSGARLPAELAARLAETAGAALTTDTPPPRWILLIEAAAAAPVRIAVRPEGVPASMTPEQREKARRLSGRIPALAKLLGIPIPPPPSPIKTRRK